MGARIAAVAVVCLLSATAPVSGQDVFPSDFSGTWVGVQRWGIDGPPPSVEEGQSVTLILSVDDDGKVSGGMRPFLGGFDGASITGSEMSGQTLTATAIVGRPRPPGAPPRSFDAWKDDVRVVFRFWRVGDALKGTAELSVGDARWLTFQYDLVRTPVAAVHQRSGTVDGFE